MCQPAPKGITLKASEGGERGQHRCADVEDVDRRGREEALLADQLDEVGDRLEEPERAGAVRAVAELHAPEHLALDPGHVGERAEQQVDDQERLDRGDPPGLVHGFVTSTKPPSSPACSLGDPRDPGSQRRVDPGAQLAENGLVRDRHGLAVQDLARLGVLGRELDLGRRPLELQLGNPLDGRAREERAVTDEPQLSLAAGLGHRVRQRPRAGPRCACAARPAPRPRRREARRRSARRAR